MSERRFDPDQNPHGELASAAIAIAFALRVRGREDDQAAAALLARLGERARMHLADSVQRDLLASLDVEDARSLALFDAAMGVGAGGKFEEAIADTERPVSFLHAQVYQGGYSRWIRSMEEKR